MKLYNLIATIAQPQVDLSSLRRPFKSNDRVSVHVGEARANPGLQLTSTLGMSSRLEVFPMEPRFPFRTWQAESIYEDFEAQSQNITFPTSTDVVFAGPF